MADYAGLLDILTAGLIAMALVEIIYLARTDKTANRMATVAEKQMLLAGRQADIVEKQKELTRLQYYAQHRPKLEVRGVFFTMDGELTFEIVNVGSIPATITNGWAALGHISDERWFRRREDADISEDLDGRRFDGGELKAFTMTGNTVEIAAEVLSPIAFLDRTSPHLYFYGAFHYVDDRGSEFGTERMTVFRREWHSDGVDESFRRTGNPDHEYSD